MADVLRKISIPKPPVSLDMYKSSYMTDYRPYNDYKPGRESHSQKTKLAEAKVKAKEFTRPSKYRPPVMYKEDPVSQQRETVQGPCSHAPMSSDNKLEKGHKGDFFAPESFQEVQEDQRKYFNTVLPNAERYLSKCYPLTEQTAIQEDKMEGTQIPALPGREVSYPSPSYSQPPAITAQCPEKEDAFNSDGASTYSTDYKRWPGIHNGCRKAQRNLSNIFFEDGHCNQSPWVSEYKDSYSIFLQKLNWPSCSAMSALCSAVKPIPHLSHGLSSHKPIPVNAVF